MRCPEKSQKDGTLDIIKHLGSSKLWLLTPEILI